MRPAALAAAAVAIVAVAAPVHAAPSSDSNTPGGVLVETPAGREYWQQFPHYEARVIFTGPVRVEHLAGRHTRVTMQLDGPPGDPGQLVVVHVQPSSHTAG